MYRWCSFCQKFLGEKEPKVDFSLTHGICENCLIQNKENKPINGLNIHQLKNFYNKLHEKVLTKESFDKLTILSEAKKLNIHPSDLLIGIIQPLLYQIGELYKNGTITPVHEHLFSDFVHEFLYELKKQVKTVNREPEVLLTCANNNYHTIGVQLLELILTQNDISVRILTPGLSAEDVYSYAKSLKVKVIGLSISIPEQFVSAIKMNELINSNNFKPWFVVGGFGVRENTRWIEGINLYSGNINELVKVINQKIAI